MANDAPNTGAPTRAPATHWITASVAAGILGTCAIHAPDNWLASLLTVAALAAMAIVALEEPEQRPEPDSPLKPYLRPDPAQAAKAVRS